MFFWRPLNVTCCGCSFVCPYLSLHAFWSFNNLVSHIIPHGRLEVQDTNNTSNYNSNQDISMKERDYALKTPSAAEHRDNLEHDHDQV